MTGTPKAGACRPATPIDRQLRVHLPTLSVPEGADESKGRATHKCRSGRPGAGRDTQAIAWPGEDASGGALRALFRTLLRDDAPMRGDLAAGGAGDPHGRSGSHAGAPIA